MMVDRYLLGAGAFGGQFVVVLPTRILAQSSAIAIREVIGAAVQQSLDRLLILKDQVHVACNRTTYSNEFQNQ